MINLKKKIVNIGNSQGIIIGKLIGSKDDIIDVTINKIIKQKKDPEFKLQGKL